MPSGPVWKGHLKISLVSVPVQAISAATTGGGRISLNQLHAECGSRIRYTKTCPVHGEVPNNEIVSGYEFAKGQYAIIDPDEIEKLRTDADRSLDISAFVKAGTIDPVYFAGKSYYLLPDGSSGEKPYRLIRNAMEEKRVHAVGQLMISKREELVIIRPSDDILIVTSLHYSSQVKPRENVVPEFSKVTASRQEVQLTNQLIDALTARRFDLADYHDVYTEKLRLLIDAKVEGREITAAEEVHEPPVINLLDAIKQSLKEKSSTAGKKTGKRLPSLKEMRQVSAARRKSPAKRKSG